MNSTQVVWGRFILIYLEGVIQLIELRAVVIDVNYNHCEICKGRVHTIKNMHSHIERVTRKALTINYIQDIELPVTVNANKASTISNFIYQCATICIGGIYLETDSCVTWQHLHHIKCTWQWTDYRRNIIKIDDSKPYFNVKVNEEQPQADSN